MKPNDWALHLDVSETLLWTGRPDARFRILWREFVFLVFGTLFGLWAALMVWLGAGWGTTTGTAHGPSLALGLGFAVAALGFWLLPAWLDRRRRQRTAYALTTQHALIQEGDRVERWPLTPNMPLTTWRGGIRLGRKQAPAYRGYRWAVVGFEHLGDARPEALSHLQALKSRLR